MRLKHCCDSMNYFINQKCGEHQSIYQCPDIIIAYSKIFDEYGIIIHDGGESSIQIKHCPWCGKKLPESKRDLWFDEIEKIGITDPKDENIPAKFQSDEWWKEHLK